MRVRSVRYYEVCPQGHQFWVTLWVKHRRKSSMPSRIRTCDLRIRRTRVRLGLPSVTVLIALYVFGGCFPLPCSASARRFQDTVSPTVSWRFSHPAAGVDPKTRGSFPAIVPLNNPWELRAFGLTHQAPGPSCRRCGSGCWPHAVRASLRVRKRERSYPATTALPTRRQGCEFSCKSPLIAVDLTEAAHCKHRDRL